MRIRLQVLPKEVHQKLQLDDTREDPQFIDFHLRGLWEEFQKTG